MNRKDRISLLNQVMVRQEEKSHHDLFVKNQTYGGYYINSEKSLVINMTDTRGYTYTKKAIIESLRNNGLEDVYTDRILVRKVDYSFLSLSNWRELLSYTLLGNPNHKGVVTVGVNYEKSKFEIGISQDNESANYTNQLLELIERDLLIPKNAVSFRSAVNDVLLQSNSRLDILYRPLMAGLSIYRLSPNAANCTLGFVGERNNQNVFITNSHCSSVLFGADNSTFIQGFLDSNNLIGTEIYDPNTQNCGGIWVAFNCRRSDASVYSVNPSTNVSLGKIARPLHLNYPNAGQVTESKILNPMTPTFSIAKSNDFIAQGIRVNKVGARTGWTDGIVTSACVDRLYPGGWWRLLCQYEVSGLASSGDSGSPVFRLVLSNDGTEHASLMGLLYAGGSGYFVFSSMSGLRQDLGDILVDDPNSTYVEPPPNTGCANCDIVIDPCVENPINCNQP